MKRRPKRSPKPGIDTVYFRSLNALVDRLFQVAFDKRMDWIAMARASGLARETVHRLGTRVTRYPQFRTIELLANGLGGKIEYSNGTERKQVAVKWTPKVFNGSRRKAA